MSDEAIFAAAKQLDDADARAAYLQTACGNDLERKQRIEALLAADQERDSLFDVPFFDGSTERYVTSNVMLGDSIGPYKLLQRIGEGGFGVVFMAEQRQPLNRRVALKIIKPGMDSRQVIARFEAERQALAMMDHPNIAKVYDAGVTDFGQPYFVMELVKGFPITHFCDEQKLPVSERLRLLLPVCRAIQHAHQKGIIHRDIKPSNVLVSLYDGTPTPKVIDFGVAKAVERPLTEKTIFTQFGQILGTPEYMSPEQAELNQLDIDTRSDVYALGCLLYELLTGSTPLDRQRLRSAAFDQMLRMLREEEPPRPSVRLTSAANAATVSAQRALDPKRLSQLVRGELDWVTMRALEKDRSRRYATAYELAADIEAHLSGQPVSAAAPSTMYRIRKYVRRHKAALAVAATIVGLLVAGTVVSSALAVRAVRATSNERAHRIVAERNERQAEQERHKAADAQRRAERLAYSAAMSLASSDWADGNLVRLEQTLEATASYPDLGFEWYHRHDQLHQDLRTINLPLPGMALSNVYGMTAAAHGGMIIINSSNGTYVLDADSGDIRTAYGYGVVSNDGRWLATGGTSGQLYTLIDTTTGMRRPVRLPERLWIRAISPDGTLVAAWRSPHRLGVWDESHLRVWNTKTAKLVYDISVAPQKFSDVYFSPDGQWIAGGVFGSDASEQQIKLWRTSDGEETRAIKSVDFGFLRGFTPNSKYVVRVDTRDGISRLIYLHDTSNLADVKRIPAENLAYLRVAFSPDSQYLATATDEGMITIKDIENGRTLATYRGHRSDVQAVAFSHDGCRVITCSSDGSLKFWPVDDINYIRTDAAVIGTWLSADGTRLLAQSIDAPMGAQLIDVSSRRILQTYRDVYISNIFPDGKRIVTAPPHRDEAATAPITIADDTGQVLKTFACDPYVNRLSVSPDGRRILVASNTSFSVLDADSGKVIIRRLQDGKERTSAVEPRKGLWSAAFSPDGKRLALSFLDEHRIVICDAETGRMVDSIPLDPDAKEGSHCADYSRDGRQILVAYQSTDLKNHGVSIYDVATKKRIQRIVGHVRPITAASFFPDGRRIITASEDRTVRLWDVENGFELLSLRADEIIAVAVTPSGRTITIPGRHGIFLAKAATPEQVSAWWTDATQPQDDGWWRRQGGVQDWLVLAPIAVSLSEDYGGDLDREQLAGEADFDPRPGDDLRLGDLELTWRQVNIDNWALNFDSVVGPGQDYCLGYAVAHIHSDKAREGVRLLVGSDDLAKIYLNGEAVYQFRGWRPMFPADDETLVNLQKGKNVLVFKVIDITGNWGATAQLVGEDYQPIAGVTTGIRP